MSKLAIGIICFVIGTFVGIMCMAILAAGNNRGDI